MEITTKYNESQEVYYMEDNKVTIAKVKTIYIETYTYYLSWNRVWTKIKYLLTKQNKEFEMVEKELYETKADLLNSL